jgi:hypothetical protein
LTSTSTTPSRSQEELVTRLAFLHQRLALLEVAPFELLALAHDRDRQLTLEVDSTAVVAPANPPRPGTCSLPCEGPVPLAEIDRPDFSTTLPSSS